MAAVLGRLRQRSGVLLLATIVVMAAASIATHFAGASGGALSGEAGETTEHGAVLVPPVVGALGALALLGLVWSLAEPR